MDTTVRERAYLHIRRQVATGVLASGSRISPVTIAKQLGVSHVPVREAISQLHSEGLLIQEAGRGAFVRKLERQELLDLIELRSVLEKNAAAQAARRISDADLDVLHSKLNSLLALSVETKKSTVDIRESIQERWVIHDLEFHHVLLEVAGNKQVLKLIHDTRMMIRMFGYRTDPPLAWADFAAYLRQMYELHVDIYRAIRRRDPKAARKAMGRHMTQARRNMLSRLDWAQKQAGLLVTESFAAPVRDRIEQIDAGKKMI